MNYFSNLLKCSVNCFAVLLLACSNLEPEVQNFDKSYLAKIPMTEDQQLIFAHYENVNNIFKSNYEGCCILNRERLDFALTIISIFEEETGLEFANRNMLIGSNDKQILVYIIPSEGEYSNSNSEKSFSISIDKNTGKRLEFVTLVE